MGCLKSFPKELFRNFSNANSKEVVKGVSVEFLKDRFEKVLEELLKEPGDRNRRPCK
jgi:hypothetical protein